MTIISKEFIQYTINYFSRKKMIKGKTHSIPEVNLQLFDKKFERVGMIIFQDKLPVDVNYVGDENVENSIIIHYPISRFDDIINILRYEKPLFIYINDGNWNGGITTAHEPIGEQEA